MATPEEILDSSTPGASPAPPSPVDQVLAQVSPAAGSYAPAAEALNANIHEGHIGDPVENGEHVVAHVGLQGLLNNKLGDKIVRAAESAETPEGAGVAGLGHVEKAVSGHQGLLEKRATGAFAEDGPTTTEKPLSSDEYQKIVQKVNNLAANSTALINDLSGATSALHAVAPQTAQSAQQTATRAIQFLASKSQQPDPDPLGAPYEASETERSRFNRYLTIVENPTHALEEVRQGTLIPETVETLSTVYPKLYDKMKQSLIEGLTPETPYAKKMTVSQFLAGDPLDHSLTPERIVSIQSSFASAAKQDAPAPSPKRSLSKVEVADRTSLRLKDKD